MLDTKPSWVAPAALAIAVIAVALAVWGLVRTPSTASISGDAAKTEVCGAFDIVRKAVSLQTNGDLGPDPVASQAVAANARLATLGGGEFLRSTLDDAEVSSELADEVKAFAKNLEYIGMGQLAGAAGDDAAQATRMTDAQANADRVAELCK